MLTCFLIAFDVYYLYRKTKKFLIFYNFFSQQRAVYLLNVLWLKEK